MSSCALIIRTCRHTLHGGRRCLQPAVRGRTRCRHHLDAQARLHNMARARRVSTILRVRVLETERDFRWNQAEVARVLATGILDPAAARLMSQAMKLIASTFSARANAAPLYVQYQPPKPNRIYEVPANPIFSASLY